MGQTKAGKVENQSGMTVKKLTKKNNQKWLNLIESNITTRGPNAKRKVGKAGEDVRAASAS